MTNILGDMLSFYLEIGGQLQCLCPKNYFEENLRKTKQGTWLLTCHHRSWQNMPTLVISYSHRCVCVDSFFFFSISSISNCCFMSNIYSILAKTRILKITLSIVVGEYEEPLTSNDCVVNGWCL